MFDSKGLHVEEKERASSTFPSSGSEVVDSNLGGGFEDELKMSPDAKQCEVLSMALQSQKGDHSYSRSSMFCSSLYSSASTSLERNHHPLARIPFLPHPPKCVKLIDEFDSSDSPLVLSSDSGLPCSSKEQEGDLTDNFLNPVSAAVSDSSFHGENYASDCLAINEQMELDILSEQLGIAMTDNEGYPQLDDIYEPSQSRSEPAVEMIACDQNEEQSVPLVQAQSKSSAGKMASVNKPRLRWTPELHERFVEAVNKLDGAEKATPKGVLKLMDVKGLTIYHVKSHLQKYRFATYLPEKRECATQQSGAMVTFSISGVGSSLVTGARDEKASSSDREEKALASVDGKCDMKDKGNMAVMEALRVQIEVQKQLHEQLEVQRKLQLRIEEQARCLQKLLEEQQKASNSISCSYNSSSTGSQPNSDLHIGCSPQPLPLSSPEVAEKVSSSPQQMASPREQKKPKLDD